LDELYAIIESEEARATGRTTFRSAKVGLPSSIPSIRAGGAITGASCHTSRRACVVSGQSRPEKRANWAGCSAPRAAFIARRREPRPATRIGLTTSLTRSDTRVPRVIAGLNHGVNILSYFELDIRGGRNNIQNVINVGLRLVELRCA
jgi:hypothetical protein